MKLLEYKGKELLKSCGIHVPAHVVVNNNSYINLSFHKERYRQFFFENGNVIIKAQVIGNGRKKQGLIIDPASYEDSLKAIDTLYKKTYHNIPITTLLIERKMNVAAEYFLAIVYDTKTRTPLLLFSSEGGIEIEETAQAKGLLTYPIDPIKGLREYEARSLAKQAGIASQAMLQLASFMVKAYQCFEKYDCRILEINPILKTKDGNLYAGDAKITIDDNAVARLEVFHDVTDIEDQATMSERELEARKIDYTDHRGVAGKTYLELDGDIAVLASGGGASLTSMDAIIQAGGNPANYTEYSGNPPKEKVKRLTHITLSKPGLVGCLIIGGKANFTDIYETLSGVMEAIVEIKPKYPIVIRRAGPRDKEAFAMIREIAQKEQLDITLLGEETPMSKAAHVMVEKVHTYKQKMGIQSKNSSSIHAHTNGTVK